MSEPKPMIVVATLKGYYGDKTRYPGERFAIADGSLISTRWMVDPSGPDYTSDHRAMEAAYAATSGKGSTRTVTDEQLIAEVTQSSGVIAGLRAENLQLKEKISALEGQLDRALAGAKGSVSGSEVRADTARARRAAAAKADQEPEREPEVEPAGEDTNPAGDVNAGDEAPIRRIRR